MSTAETNILTLITADHRKIEQLFQELASASKFEVINCFNQLYKELTLHTKAEEFAFYAAMQEYAETQQYVEAAAAEHNSATVMLEQMKSFNPSDQEFQTKLMHLKETILRHIQVEETEIFDAVRRCIDEQNLQRLGQEFQDTKVKSEAEVEMSLTL